ncbi:hypothetical protein SAMN05444722_1661 [Rhodovulum sp. ES.010]|uniref:hypothetical protein n=1 Tax=Rhodovulum sp. ES.010 TaxID=1882821 RepID=UPI000927DA4A|nr:hypothetical protein [Rhodovulum sp. ES.010]SIO36012.1 hypothetical protein SAMN05444722_1661 [Rhodovulum sp. ES.010]
MPHTTKIATCCYCGTRAVLSLRGRQRHELSCSACGAPLHAMKRLRADRDAPRAAPARRARPPEWSPPRPKTRKRKRKAIWRKAFEEVVDTLEDIFD